MDFAVISDLDGTLLDSKRTIALRDRETLEQIPNWGGLRIFATGRCLLAAVNVLDAGIGLDYLVFASGAGVLDWKTKTLLSTRFLDFKEVALISRVLEEQEIDYCIQSPSPECHRFVYRQFSTSNADLLKRLEIFSSFCRKLEDPDLEALHLKASHFVAIVEDRGEEVCWRLTKQLKDFEVVRTTSPLDGKTVWIEVFAKQVSKAYGSSFALEHFGLKHVPTMAIGNDYNDLAMLRWTEHAYVVPHAPEPLKAEFKVAPLQTGAPLTDAFLDFQKKLGIGS